jgi:hypothetical protein
MSTVTAYLNYGRWLVNCPKHGKNGATQVSLETTEYIAPCCYPGITAQFMAAGKGKITVIPDESARATARNLAVENEEVHQVVFPENFSEIMAVVSLRPIQNQNWEPGETLEFLQAENNEHGVV